MSAAVHFSVLHAGADEHVALRAAVGRSGAQALERIDHERQRLELDDDAVDGFGGEFFAVGGDGENRFAFVDRFVGQRDIPAASAEAAARPRPRLVPRQRGGRRRRSSRRRGTGGRRRSRRCAAAPGAAACGGVAPAGCPEACRRSSGRGGRRWRSRRRRRRRQILGGQNAVHAGHGQRGRRVDAEHPRVRTRARHQLDEDHAVGTEVFGVLRLAGDLRDQVGRDVVVAEELELHLLGRLDGLCRRDWLLLFSHGLRPPRLVGCDHHDVENLVVVGTPAQVAGNAVRQLLARRRSGWS